MNARDSVERIDARERLARAYDANAPMLYRLTRAGDGRPCLSLIYTKSWRASGAGSN
jgi:hypothetical protein